MSDVFRTISSAVLLAILLVSFNIHAEAKPSVLKISVTIPKLEVEPYYRPYLAIWIETQGRDGIHTIALSSEQDEYLKDLRQWWRKLGHQNASEYDGVTGPTQRPGTYQFVWQGETSNKQHLPAGEYAICIEATREEGGREFLRQPFTWPATAPQQWLLVGSHELGELRISIE